MPWKASSVMEERLRFAARLLDGEAMRAPVRLLGLQPNNLLTIERDVAKTLRDSKSYRIGRFITNTIRTVTRSP
jgi:hypothetical protein